MIVVAIVDFDNYFPKQIGDYPETYLQSFFTYVIDKIISEKYNVERIIIRLYGGWYKECRYTQKASQLQIKLQSISIFPIIVANKRIDGTIEMAEQQYGVNHTWYNTFQEKAGLQKVKINWEKTSEHCTHKAPSCPVKVMTNFMKDRKHQCSTQGCGTIQEEVFFRREQKMVDTMMTCDIITYSAEKDIGSLYIYSDDIDLFPAIAICNAKYPGTLISLVMKNRKMLDEYRNILSDFNTNVTLCNIL